MIAEKSLHFKLKWLWSEIIRVALQWRHNERVGVSNQRYLGCLLSRLFRRR